MSLGTGKRTNEVFVSLGSNMGIREENLNIAIAELNELKGVRIQAISSIYETEPVGYTDQAPFLNMVVKLETTYTPEEMLEKIQEIERVGGRKRELRWGPRTIDLDILLYNHENIDLEQLQVPHPRMYDRGFVLIPLREIAPKLTFSDGKTIDEYIELLTDKEGVQKWNSKSGEDASEHSES